MGLSSNQSQIAFRIDGWLDEWQMVDGSWQLAFLKNEIVLYLAKLPLNQGDK